MRSVALADAARKRRMQVSFVVDPRSQVVEAVGRRGYLLRAPGSGQATWFDDLRPDDIVVFDGYGLPGREREAAKARGARVVVVDDLGTADTNMHVLVAPDQDQLTASRVAGPVTILSGMRYALIREEFRVRRRLRKSGSSRLAVTLGGGTTASLEPIVRWLHDRQVFPQVGLIVGPLADAPNPHAPGITLIVNPPDLATELDLYDAALTGAGTTMLELCCMGMPLAAVRVAADQALAAARVAAVGAGIVIGGFDDLLASTDILQRLADPRAGALMSERGLDLVDGLGASRVLDAALSLQR